MRIKVLRSANEHCWYSEAIGDVFYVFQIPDSMIFWFSNSLFFYPQDIELTRECPKHVMMPTLAIRGLA